MGVSFSGLVMTQLAPAPGPDCQEGLVDRMPVGKPERNVAGTKVDVDPEFLAYHLDGSECHPPGLLVSTHGQHQRVDNHILGRDAQPGSPFQDFPAIFRRTSGSVGIPLSSMVRPITAAPYSLMIGSSLPDSLLHR